MLLGFEIGQRWPEAMMHSCGSYFVPVSKGVESDWMVSCSIRFNSQKLVCSLSCKENRVMKI
jgi:hypothetical protein